nr:site-specific integrase [uncultured Anaerosporobacter sp.]
MRIEATNKKTKDTTKVKKTEKKEKLPSGITRRKDGRFLIRKQGNGLILSQYTWEVEEALRVREEFISRIKAHKTDENEIKNKNVKLSEKTLGEVYRISMNNARNIRPSTKSTYEQYWKCYLEKSFLSKMVIKDITRKEVKKAYEEILNKRDRQLSQSTMTIINIIVKRCIGYVNFEEENNFNPTKGVMCFFKLPKAKEKKIITEEEIKLLIEFMTNEKYTKYLNIFKFMVLSGTRIGEALSLTWADINFTENTYCIQKSMHYRKLDANGKYVLYVSSLKTDRSYRTNPMSKELRDALLNEKSRQQDNNIVCSKQLDYINDRGKKEGKIGDFVFINAEGKPYSEESIRTAFKRIVKNCNAWEVKRSEEESREPRVVNEFTPHATRHTTITSMMNNGVNIKVVQRIAGHADIKTTLSKYCHVSRQDLVQAVNQTKMIS